MQKPSGFSGLLIQLGELLQQATSSLSSVDSMAHSDKQEAIALAKEILEKLNQSGDDERFRSQQEVSIENLEEMELLVELVMDYQQELNAAALSDPALLRHQDVLAANEAIGSLAHIAFNQAEEQALAEGNTPLADKAAKCRNQLPANQRNPKRRNVRELMNTVFSALKTLLSRIDANPNRQLQQTNNKQANQTGLSPRSQSMRQTRENIAIHLDDDYHHQLDARKRQMEASREQLTFQRGANILAATIGTMAHTLLKHELMRTTRQPSASKGNDLDMDGIDDRLEMHPPQIAVPQHGQQKPKGQQPDMSAQQQMQEQQRIIRQQQVRREAKAQQKQQAKEQGKASPTVGTHLGLEALIRQAGKSLGNAGIKGNGESVGMDSVGKLKPTTKDLPDKPIDPSRKR